MEIGADNKDKIAERRFAEMNQTLRKEHLLQQDYYKELLDVQSCGVMAYTLPGHRIVHMNAEALRMYGYYDLILMDIQMPVMNGYEATANIRAGESDYWKTIPVIAMTANVFQEDESRAAECGMSDYVTKPIDMNVIYSVLEKWLRGQKG